MNTQTAFTTPFCVTSATIFGISTTSTRRPKKFYIKERARNVFVCTTTPTDVTPSSSSSTAEVDPELIEKSFKRLRHANPTQRQAASSQLASLGTPEIIERLISLLSETDTSYRRAAVQALGMCGLAAVTSIVAELQSTDNATVRASCAKALAATGLYHPDLRAEFPADALESLKNVMKNADPVTKLASVGCLGTLGSDAGVDMKGNEVAYQTLADMLEDGLDVAIGAVAVGAIAQIAQNGDEQRKNDVLQKLRRLVDGSNANDTESGLGYVREMAKSHVEQLEGKDSGGSGSAKSQ